jgi:hypothetical protein
MGRNTGWFGRVTLMLLVGGAGGGCGDAVARVDPTGAAGFVEPDTGLLVVDADVLADSESTSTDQGLTVALVGGHDDVWPTTARKDLSYCVDRASFGPWASTVAAALAEATADWERSANVRFVPLDRAACSRTSTAVVFDVRRVEGRPYLARSFFPSSPRAQRELLVDGTALPAPSPLTLTGVLRHELGHVLGLRHEHTRQADNPCYEDDHWRAVTAYDVRSVMHYPQCAGVMGRDLTLTPRDREGIALLYP